MKRVKLTYVCFLIMFFSLFVLFPTTSMAEQKSVEVTAMAHPFGTPQYAIMTAFEEVFKQANSSVKWRTIETPGAMYMMKWVLANHDKVATQEVPQWAVAGENASTLFVNEGRPPLGKLKNPHVRALFSLPGFMTLFVTFNPEIKTMEDLAGKKVGTVEKARIFTGDLANRPYFGKGLGIWDKIKWNHLGAINSKDAMLNKKIDAMQTNFYGNVKISSDGTYVCTQIVPSPSLLELLDSGRKLYVIGFDPKIIRKSYNIKTDFFHEPVLIKKGAYQGIDHDVWGRNLFAQIITDASMPDDVVQEIIRVRHTYRDELGKYHAVLKLLPDTPYPLGTPKKFIHPGVEKAMKNLGIPIPKIEVKY